MENGEICKPFFVVVLFSLHLLDANSVPPFNKKPAALLCIVGFFGNKTKKVKSNAVHGGRLMHDKQMYPVVRRG